VGYGVGGGENRMTLEEVEQMPDGEAGKLYDALLMLVDAGFIRVDKADGQELDTDMVNTLIIHGGQAHARRDARRASVIAAHS
jgi:hypothetical protein